MTRIRKRVLDGIVALVAIAGLAVPASASDGGWLGVMLRAGTEAEVTSVLDDSPAAAAGLESGDVIVAVDSQPVVGYAELKRALGEHREGDLVRLTVDRDGAEQELDVTLGATPPAAGLPRALKRRMQRLHHAWGVAPKVRLGVQLQPLSDGLREYFRAPSDRGVLVSDVVSGSAAAGAGIRAGDVILAIDDRSVASAGEIRKALTEREPGDAIRVLVLRDGAEQSLEARLTEPPRRSNADGCQGCQGCDFGFDFHFDGAGLGDGDWQDLTPEQRAEVEAALADLPRILERSLAVVPEVLHATLVDLPEILRGSLGGLHLQLDDDDLDQIGDDLDQALEDLDAVGIVSSGDTDI